MKKNAKSLSLILFIVVILSAWSAAVPNSMTVDLSDLPPAPCSQHLLAADTQDYIDSQSNVDSHADHGTHDVFADLQGYEGTMDYFLEGNTGTSLVSYQDYVDSTSNIDSHADHGAHDIFSDLQAYGSPFDTMTEANTGGTGTNTHDYVDNTSNLHTPSDIGTRTSFPEEQDFDAVYDTLTEANAGTNTEDYVDTISNLRAPADIGTHSAFANEQLKDAVYDTLTEVGQTQVAYIAAGIGAAGTTTTITPGYPASPQTGDLFLCQIMVLGTTVGITSLTGFTALLGPYTSGTDGRAWVYYRYSVGTETGTTTLTTGAGTVGRFARIYSFRYVHQTIGSAYEAVNWVDEGSVSTILDRGVTTTNTKELAVNMVFNGEDIGNEYLDFTGETGGDWTEVVAEYSNAAGNDGTLQLQCATMASAATVDGGSYDATAADPTGVLGFALKPTAINYRLDLEVGWTAADYDETNEYLCVYTGTQGTEDLKVEIWSGAAWVNVIADLTAATWNNVSITTYLTDATVEVRFLDTSTVGDSSTGDAWQIDAVLIHTWSTNYRLDLEVGWTAADYDEINEYLCLRGGNQDTEALMVDVWNGAGWTNVIADVVGDDSAPLWNNVSISSYLTSSAFEIRFIDTTQSSDSAQGTWKVEAVLLHVWGTAINYELDLEAQWSSAQYSESNEQLCVRTDTHASGSESFNVQVYSSGWVTVITGLSWSTWNNVSVTTYLTSSAFYVRFIGATESGDSVQDVINVDCALLHCWTPAAPLYELDLEGQWTAADYDESNEYLCIYAGTQDAEACLVQVYSSGWVTLVSDLVASSWNNVSVSTYLTSATFTIRFLGGSESSDTTQSGWNIDCALLHTWTADSAPINDTLPTVTNLNDGDNMYPHFTKYSFYGTVESSDGYTDISYVELSLSTYWTWRFNVTTGEFIEQSGETFTDLDTSGSSHTHADANHIEITWLAYIEWEHTDTVNQDLTQFVQDVHSPSDTDTNTANDYDILTAVEIWDILGEHIVDVCDWVMDGSRGNINGQTSATAMIVWTSDESLFPDNDLIDVWVGCTDVATSPWQLTYTEGTGNATGWVQADDVSGADTYTFRVVHNNTGYAGDLEDSTTHIYTAERVLVNTLAAEIGRVGVTETAYQAMTLKYESDSAAVTTGTVTLDGISATYSAAHGHWHISESKSTTQLVTYDGPLTCTGDFYGVSETYMDGKSSSQIWDRGIIDSFYTNDTRASTTQHVTIYLTGHLEYDGHPFGSGDEIQIDPSASNMTWDAGDARFEYDAWSDIGDKRTYSLTALTEATYGIKKFQTPSTFDVWWDYVIRSSYSVTDTRDNVGDQINVTQYLYYWGDSAPLTTGSVTFNGIAASHIGGGYWRISRTQYSTTSEFYNNTQCAGDDTYGIYSESGSFETTIIWDCAIWTSVSISDDRVNLDDSVNVTFHLHLDYDDSDITSGTVYIEGILATNLGGGDWRITDSRSSVCNITYDAVTSVSGITYDITAIGSGPSDSAVWDKMTVQTTAADDSRLNINGYSEIRVTLWREYDDTYITGGTCTVKLNGTSMSWDAVNAWWELNVTKPTVGQWAYLVSFANDTVYNLQELDTNGKSVAVVFDRAQVQGYTCADNFINTGAYLPFYVRLFYDYDNSYVDDGTVTVNGESATYAYDGWWLVNVTKGTSQSVTYNTVACSGNTYGITEEDQNGQSQVTYWDRVLITLTSTNDNRTGTGQYALISVTGEFEDYAHSLGSGDSMTLDGQAMSWNATSGHFELLVNRAAVGNYSFFVNSTAEATYGITAFSLEGCSAYVTFDKVHLVLSSNLGWTVVGYNVTISGAGGHYEYDSAPWTGTFDIDGMGAYPHYDTAQNKSVEASSVTDPTYGVTSVICDPCYVVWDDVQAMSGPTYYWVQYGVDAVWMIWGAPSSWAWEINGTWLQQGTLMVAHMNGSENAKAAIWSPTGDLGGLAIGPFSPTWYYADLSVNTEITVGSASYDWPIWDGQFEVEIMHTIHLVSLVVDIDDNWVTFYYTTNWANATLTIWDNETIVGYSQWEGAYQIAKPTVVGLHNYTLLINGTHSGSSYADQVKNSVLSNSWVWQGRKYTVNPIQLSFDDVQFAQNNESVVITGRVWTSATTLYWTVYEAALGWTTGTISGVSSGSWISWYWDKSSSISTSNFTVYMSDATYNCTFRGFYIRISGGSWVIYGGSAVGDTTYVQNSTIIYANPQGLFMDQATAAFLSFGIPTALFFAYLMHRISLKKAVLKAIRKEQRT